MVLVVLAAFRLAGLANGDALFQYTAKVRRVARKETRGQRAQVRAVQVSAYAGGHLPDVLLVQTAVRTGLAGCNARDQVWQ